jgi:PEP-CTERM motif
MRRVVLMAVLALAMPMAAFADSIIFSDSGTLNSAGTITPTSTASFTGSIANGSSYTLNVPLTLFSDNGATTATAGTVSLSTGTLTQVGAGQFTFTGTVTVTNSASAVLFTSSVAGGTITHQSNGSYSINGLLANGGLNSILGTKISGSRLVSGNGNAVTGTSVVPEPGTLGLLGTGLIGIAGLIRRKTRIG